MVIGDSNGLADLLSNEKMQLLAVPSVKSAAGSDDWRGVLFDLVVKSPSGQLAPLSARTVFVASRWQRAAFIAGALSFSLAAAFAGSVLLRHASRQRCGGRTQLQLTNAHRFLDKEMDRRLKKYGKKMDASTNQKST